MSFVDVLYRRTGKEDPFVNDLMSLQVKDVYTYTETHDFHLLKKVKIYKGNLLLVKKTLTTK